MRENKLCFGNLTASEVIGAIDAVEKLHQALKDHIK